MTPDQTRLVLFGDSRSWISTTLLAALARAARRHDRVELVGVVDASRSPARPSRVPLRLGGRAARRAFNPRRRSYGVEHPALLATCATVARRARVPLLVAPGGGVNDPDLVGRVRALRPDASLALMVPAIFGAELLEACRAPANYHNGLLPAYRGVAATQWSVYDGAARSGFTVHWMTDEVDGGRILLEDSVAVDADTLPVEVERAKTRLASGERTADMLELLVRRSRGAPQAGPARYRSRAETDAISLIGDPAAMSWAELQRRLRAFELVELELAGGRWPATALRRRGGGERAGALSFATADGVHAVVSRCKHLPPAAYRGYRALRGLRG